MNDLRLHARREFLTFLAASPYVAALGGAVVFLCPTGGEKSFHAEGELAVARAARARDALQVLSTAASTGIEDVNKELGRPAWYQVYAPNSWEANEALLKRVEAAGSTVIALTV